MSEDAADAGTSFPFWQVYRVPIILGCLSLLFIVLSITIFIKSYQVAAPIRFSSDTSEAISSASGQPDPGMLIDIEGAVLTPGLYRLPVGSRVHDLLELAGGLAPQADTVAVSRTINRAAKLTDGAKIYIPFIGESVNAENAGSSTVNINTASSRELESLNGIGVATAAKIISGRPYLRLEDLVDKNVIGRALFEKISSQITL
ncbi:ComEA family DNA-binding protein [Candidatus Gottesmanbacteria bacterium]|nr:ComEA family DNA-binding protein [Candidatus Gottesmanbacteria bacterium]